MTIADWIARVTVAVALAVQTILASAQQYAPTAAPSATREAERHVTRGVATWYDWRPGQAAAGPALRKLLGASWRGSRVRVCSGSRCVVVRLTDWCACGARNGVPTVIDLDRRSFAALAAPSRGVIRVEVRP